MSRAASTALRACATGVYYRLTSYLLYGPVVRIERDLLVLNTEILNANLVSGSTTLLSWFSFSVILAGRAREKQAIRYGRPKYPNIWHPGSYGGSTGVGIQSEISAPVVPGCTAPWYPGTST
eukprot:3733560-Rhodomonas_salina.1